MLSTVIEADHTVELLLHEPRPILVESPSRRWRLTRRGWWRLGIASCSAFGVIVGLLVFDQVSQREQFDHSQAALSATRQHITAVSAQLAELQDDLAALTTQVGDDTAAYDQAASELQGARTALNSAQTNVTQQASQISSLRTCLGGVEQALNALAVNNQQRAFALLESVSSSCTTAAAISG